MNLTSIADSIQNEQEEHDIAFTSCVRQIRRINDICCIGLVVVAVLLCMIGIGASVSCLFASAGTLLAIVVIYAVTLRWKISWMISVDEATNESRNLEMRLMREQAKFNEQCLKALATLNNSLGVLDNNSTVRTQEVVNAILSLKH